MQIELVGQNQLLGRSFFARQAARGKAFAARQVSNLFKKSDTAMSPESLPAVQTGPAGFMDTVPKPVLYGGVAVVALMLLGVFKRRG
jgi:hypothetical protein